MRKKRRRKKPSRPTTMIKRNPHLHHLFLGAKKAILFIVEIRIKTRHQNQLSQRWAARILNPHPVGVKSVAVQGAANVPEVEIRRCRPGNVEVKGVGLVVEVIGTADGDREVGGDVTDLGQVHPRRGQVGEVITIIIESDISLFLSVCFLFCSPPRLLGKCFLRQKIWHNLAYLSSFQENFVFFDYEFGVNRVVSIINRICWSFGLLYT